MKRSLSVLVILFMSVMSFAKDLPNVVVIYADDLGFGDLSVNNPEGKIPTPNLDKLAAQGMRFTDGHSSSGICTPSRFALLTGQHHWRRFHGIVTSMGGTVFEPDDFTLAKMFKSKGYNTAAVGKWHLGWDWDALRKPGAEKGDSRNGGNPEDYDWSKPIPDGPLAQGFDYYFGDGTINFPPYCYVENDRVTEVPTVRMDTDTFKQIPEGNWEFRQGPMVKGWNPYENLPTITEKAAAWLEKQDKDAPFFLYFAFGSPHAPIIPNEKFRGKSGAGPFGDFVCETDAMAGRILQVLEEKGFADNTIVVFSADNGPEKYAFERYRKYGHWSPGELRGLKRDVWEGGHRVPFIIRWPGNIKPGKVSDETISQVDLAATFADVIGYKLPKDEAIDSYNLVPLLRGKKYKQPLRVATVQNTFDRAFALRQGDWLFIDATSGMHSKPPKGFEEDFGYTPDTTDGLLYNLKKDLSQHDNLYGKHPEKVAAMKSLLERYKAGEPCAPHAQ